ncbi:uncharacterized protein LOC110118445 [Ceratitis capitata]|uniref:uncharacterized protein LOC110118445 n=1 Tax=Ceratitis capitata TaxID=7213 RepID=UPI000A11549F|nr:uncharacterized protein LOC110118445 [Ceratitis capitata]
MLVRHHDLNRSLPNGRTQCYPLDYHGRQDKADKSHYREWRSYLRVRLGFVVNRGEEYINSPGMPGGSRVTSGSILGPRWYYTGYIENKVVVFLAGTRTVGGNIGPLRDRL